MKPFTEGYEHHGLDPELEPLYPADLLRLYLDQITDMDIKLVSDALGFGPGVLVKFLANRVRVTSKMAIRLAQATHSHPELWLSCQYRVDLWESPRTDFSPKPLISKKQSMWVQKEWIKLNKGK